MGIFRPLIGKGLEIVPAIENLSQHILTPTNLMTAARPVLALKCAEMLLMGRRPVTPWMFLTGISDAEGNIARLIDKHFPNSGLGSSEAGADWDPVADTAAVLIVSGAALVAPRMPVAGRIAIATALGHEGFKAAWALRKNNDYRKVANERLSIKPTLAGKESMAEKFGAVGLAVLASDLDDPLARNLLAGSAIAMAMSGTIRGERERQKYDRIADELIQNASTQHVSL